MKKLLIGIGLIVTLIFTGCASSAMAYVFDPGIPEDQMSFLWVPNYIKVKQFNNKTVDWIAPLLSTAPVKVGVPTGEFTFIIDTVLTDKNLAGVPDVKNKSYTKKFETGKGYQLINRNKEIVLIDL